MTATVIPFNRFLEEREKKHDPKGYASRKIHEAISEQVRAREAAKPLLIGPQPEPIDQDFDDTPVMDKGSMAFLWGVQRDPGDEA